MQTTDPKKKRENQKDLAIIALIPSKKWYLIYYQKTEIHNIAYDLLQYEK